MLWCLMREGLSLFTSFGLFKAESPYCVHTCQMGAYTCYRAPLAFHVVCEPRSQSVQLLLNHAGACTSPEQWAL